MHENLSAYIALVPVNGQWWSVGGKVIVYLASHSKFFVYRVHGITVYEFLFTACKVYDKEMSTL